MMDIRVVTTRADAEAAHTLITGMCIESGYTERPDKQRFIHYALKNADDMAILLAWQNNVAVGTATLAKMPYLYQPGPMGIFQGLYVLPQARRDGVADKLFKAVKDEAKKRDWKAIEWFVYQDNASSLAFFKKTGLQPKGAMQEFWLSESEL